MSNETERDLCANLANRLRYEDGMLYWVHARQHRLVGKVAGRLNSGGYRRIHHNNGRMVACHRLIYFMFNNELPEVVDHIDGNPRNNRIENLRPASTCQNMRNCKTPITNTSGVKGAYFHSGIGKWTASIRVNKRLTHLGTYLNLFDAACARRSAELTHYGEFSR